MTTIITAPEDTYKPSMATKRIFMAGSIENGKAEDWQKTFAEEITKRCEDVEEDVVIFNPRRKDWNPNWKMDASNKEFGDQVEWEVENIERSEIVVFYFQPGTLSPISLFELGMVAKDSFEIKKTVIVCCPEGYHRKGNVDVYAQWFDMYIANTMEEMINITMEFIE